MITLVLLMVRLRRWRAAAVTVLAAFSVAVAVAAPAFLALADRSMINGEFAQAPTAEVSVQVQFALDISAGRDGTFESNEPTKLASPWWNITFAADMDIWLSPTASAAAPAARQTVLAYRDNYCAHIVLVSGRCPVSTREALVDTAAADGFHLGAGAVLSMFALVPGKDGPTVVGAPIAISVVGVYRVPNQADRYWGNENLFGPPAGALPPVLVERGTLELVDGAKTERQRVDALLRPDALTPSMFAQIQNKIFVARSNPNANVGIVSAIPKLINDVNADRQALRQIVPLAALPLVALACFVLFLVTAYSVQERRTEIGVVRLRGSRMPTRWWLGVGESVIPAVVGIVIGLLTGGLLARALAAATLASTTGAITSTAYPLLTVAAIVAVGVAVLVAHRRTLGESVVEVLRRVPPRSGAWRAVVAETVLVVLAGFAVAQAHLQPGPLTGIMLLAPALLIAAIAVLAARLVPPIATRVGAACLGIRSGRGGSGRGGSARRGSAHRGSGRGGKPRLGVGLGALQMARRPGAQRLLMVQIMAVGLCGFAIIAATTAAGVRADYVRAQLGAARVLTVDSIGAAALEAAVHTADPAGRYAMAAVPISPALPSDPPLLAVDSPRLAAVAAWPGGAGLTAAAVATALRPAAPSPLTISATEVAVRLTTTSMTPGVPLRLRMTLVAGDGSQSFVVDFGDLRAGDHTYTGLAPSCAIGCRLASITVDQQLREAFAVTFVLNAVRTVAPTAADVPTGLTDPARWRAVQASPGSEPTTVLATPVGLSASLAISVPGNAVGLAPINVPYPLPVVSTQHRVQSTLRGFGGQDQSVRLAGIAADLPRMGHFGALVDFEYAESVADPNASMVSPEVWVAADAPPSVVSALTAAGLHIDADVVASQQTAYLDQRGPAVGARINLLLGAGGPLLAIVCLLFMAGIDRRHRAAELGVLRMQGLSIATVRRASLVGQLGLVVAAAVIGALAALAAWIATGGRIPMLTDAVAPPLTLPGWPVVVVPAAVVAVLLALTAWATVVDTVRLTRRFGG